MSTHTSKRIDSIQAIRFFAALFVSLFHFGYISSIITGNTIFDVKFFVNLFFCISGFFVIMSTEAIEKRKLFLTKRIIRLMPLYWALTFVTFIAAHILPELLGYIPDLSQLIKSLFCIPFSRSALKAESTLRPIVGLGHTLQMEVVFSMIFSVAMRISHKKRAFVASLFAVIFALMGRLFDFDSPILKFYFNVNWSSWLFFVLGIICYHIVKGLSKKDISNTLFGMWSSITIIVLALPQFLINIIITYNISQYFQLVMCLFLLIEVILIDKKGVKTPTLIRKMGDASFSYYLIHYYIVSVSERILKIDDFSLRNILLTVAVIIISWVVAYISWYIIENKFGKWLSQKVTKIAYT